MPDRGSRFAPSGSRLPAPMLMGEGAVRPMPLTARRARPRALPAPTDEQLAVKRGEGVADGDGEKAVIAAFEKVLGLRGVEPEATASPSVVARCSRWSSSSSSNGWSLVASRWRWSSRPQRHASSPAGSAATLRRRLGQPRRAEARRNQAAALRRQRRRREPRRLRPARPPPVGRAAALRPAAEGLDGHQPLDRGIEAMAERHLAKVREVQPHGPYLLAGRFNGASVAYEMAQRLRAAGESVPVLAALDSDPPRRVRWRSPRDCPSTRRSSRLYCGPRPTVGRRHRSTTVRRCAPGCVSPSATASPVTCWRPGTGAMT